jgi:uncharacterized protein (UPF0335 family)
MSKNSDLKNFVSRIEKLNEEKDAITESINSVLSEAEAAGFDKKIVKLTVKVRQDKQKFADEITLLDRYMADIGDQLVLDFAVGAAH